MFGVTVPPARQRDPELAFNYEGLHFIELQEVGSKFPAHSWGGYSQNYEDAERVYSANDLQIHPGKAWGVVGIDDVDHGTVSLLVFDLDIHKAPADFDPDDVTIEGDVPIVRSQNGGLHTYFMVHEPPGAGSESDFQMTADLGWGIDIRGSYVSHHVVAPAEIPGIDGDYELVNDARIPGVFDPADAATRIQYNGEPLLEYDRDTGVADFEFDRPSEPPMEMPSCYHAGLELRKAAPDDYPNTHKVNVLTALCGLAAGYSTDEVAEHFCGEWAPTDGDVDLSDVGETEYQVAHLAEKLDSGTYSPPALSTLQEWGILDETDGCNCTIEYHNSDSTGLGADVDDVEDVAVLPGTPQQRAASNVWDWRAAGADNDDTDPLTAARERTQHILECALNTYDERVLVEALPTLGKSSGVIRAAAETDEPITVLTGRGRKEQYEQFEQWCDEQGLTHKTLPAFAHDCPTARGDHGNDWQDRVLDWYRRGATPQDIHKYTEQELGRPLPCQATEDGHTIDCEYAHKWNFDPDDHIDTGEPIDVLIGHYAHAHKPKVTEGRTVVFDEFPASAYETTLDGWLQGAVTQYLQRHDELPFADYTDLIERRRDDTARADALAWFLDEGALRRDPDEVFASQAGHATAPIATFALLAGDDLGNGCEHTDLTSADAEDLENASVVYNREQGVVQLLDPPALEYTRGVVGLDGTPTLRMWRRALGAPNLHHRPVLSESERREYIQNGLGLQLVPTTSAVKPYNNPNYVSVEQDAALLEAVREEHGVKPGLITSSTALHEYDIHDAVNLKQLADETAYYGNVLGSNQFGEKRVGVLTGSTHYGDDFIKKWAAYDGELVERNNEKGADLSYGDVGDEILIHMREHQTLQAAMRFGRDGNGAVVYIHTNTLPEWVPTAGEGRVLATWSDGLRQVIDALADLGNATTSEITAHPAVDVGQRQVFAHLETLHTDHGVLTRRQDDEDGRRVIWTDEGIARFNEHGDVELKDVSLDELGSDEVQELARMTTYTWEFLNRYPNLPVKDAGWEASEETTAPSPVMENDPPPHGAN